MLDRARIALLSSYPADHRTFTGGVETATAGLLEGLRAYQGEFDFHVVSVAKSTHEDVHEHRDGFSFHFLGDAGRSWIGSKLPYRVGAVCRELRRIRPDVIHCQDNMALALAAVLSGYPRVFTVHGVKRHEVGKRTGRERWGACIDALLEGYVHRHFDAYVCISPYAADVLGSGRLTVAIPNPVRSRFFEMCRNEDRGTSLYLLFAGVLAPLKRPADLLLAHEVLRREFAGLETIFCGAVEDARYAGALRKMVVERKIAGVCFAGGVSQERLAELLSGAAALVLPSAQENAPMIIAEAMAMGIPVVASRVGGVPSLVSHGKTGFLFRPGYVAELTEYLRRLLADPDLRRRLGARGRAVAEQTYRSDHVAEATTRLYRQLLQRGVALLAS